MEHGYPVGESRALWLWHITIFDGPRPWQCNALRLNSPLESEPICFKGMSQSQSVTKAAQVTGPLPSEAGPEADKIQQFSEYPSSGDANLLIAAR